MSFGNNLKKIRQENNLTQEELAKKINTSRSNIANYENDKNMPSIDILNKLSETFNCSIDYLLGKSDIKNPENSNDPLGLLKMGFNIKLHLTVIRMVCRSGQLLHKVLTAKGSCSD